MLLIRTGYPVGIKRPLDVQLTYYEVRTSYRRPKDSSSRPDVFCKKGVLKARIHFEMFLSEHFMKNIFHNSFIV